MLFILWSDTCVWTVRPGGEFQPFTISPVDDWSIFISNLQSIRNQTLEVISYNDTIYKTPDLLWAQSAYVFPQTLMWDRYLWDPEIGWTVDKFLEDLNTRYGGIDAVLLWPTYPNIGVDDR